jgi:hypothetical protein
LIDLHSLEDGLPAIHNFFLLCITPKLNLHISFEDIRVKFPSSYWLIYLSDLHRTPSKSGKQPLATFPKNFVMIWEMYQPIGRNVQCTPRLQKSFANSQAFGNKRQKK